MSEEGTAVRETPDEKAARQKSVRDANLAKGRATRRANLQRRQKEEAAAEAAAASEADASQMVHTTSAEIKERATERAEPESSPERAEPEPERAEPESSPERAEPEPEPRMRSLDQLAVKHAPVEHLPTVKEAAAAVDLGGGRSPVPSPEMRPEHNVGILSGPEVPDTSDQTPRTLEDLIELAAGFAEGSWYVRVERKTPVTYNGFSTKGLQRRVGHYMSQEDFVSLYGGGLYSLMLYGPPKSGSHYDSGTGRQRFTSYSKPVRLDISVNAYPPNVETAYLEGDDMQRYPAFSANPTNGRGHPASNADAVMHKAELDHSRAQDARRDDREDKIRDEERRAQGDIPGMLGMVTSSMQAQADAAREEQRERERVAREDKIQDRKDRQAAEAKREEERKRERDKPNDMASMANMLSTVLGTNNSRDGSKEALEELRRQADRLKDQHAAEITRLTEKHASDLASARTENERLRDRDAVSHRDDVQRTELRVKDAEDRAQQRVADSERRAERELSDVRDRSARDLRDQREVDERRYAELERNTRQRSDDIERQHERDLKAKDESFTLRLGGQKDTFENRISMMGSEHTRQAAELERVRVEAEAGKDVVGAVEKFKQTAAALGMSEDGAEPADWKSLVASTVGELAQNLPAIMEKAGETFQGRRAAVAQIQDAPGMIHGAPPPAPPLGFQPTPPMVFGTDDGYETEEVSSFEPRAHQPPEPQQPVGPGAYASEAQQPAAAPVAAQPTAPQPVAAQPTAPQPVAAQPTAPQPVAAQPQPAAPDPGQQMVPLQQTVATSHQPNAAQQIAPAADPTDAVQIPENYSLPDADLLNYDSAICAALQEGITPEQFAEHLLSQLGARAPAMLSALRPDKVQASLVRLGRPGSPLARPDGKKWLDALLESLEELLGQPE